MIMPDYSGFSDDELHLAGAVFMLGADPFEPLDDEVKAHVDAIKEELANRHPGR